MDSSDVFTLRNICESLGDYVKYTSGERERYGDKAPRINFPSHISENLVKFVYRKKYFMCPTPNCKGDLRVVHDFNYFKIMKILKKGEKFMKNPAIKKETVKKVNETIKKMWPELEKRPMSFRGISQSFMKEIQDLYFYQLEVKAFISDGPSSFGPTEQWDKLYFVDCKKYLDGEFRVWEIDCKNTDEEWRKMSISRRETFGDQADAKRRPRIPFEDGSLNVKKYFEENAPDKISLLWEGNLESLEA